MDFISVRFVEIEEYFPLATKHPRTTSIAVPTRVDMFSLSPTVLFMDILIVVVKNMEEQLEGERE